MTALKSLPMQKKAKALEKKCDDAWHEYDDAAKVIEKRKDDLIDAVEARLKQNVTENELFVVEWEIR